MIDESSANFSDLVNANLSDLKLKLIRFYSYTFETDWGITSVDCTADP